MHHDEGMLARIDERTTAILARLDHIDHRLDEDFVTAEEFAPVKKVVYGLVGLILTAVMGGIVGLVIVKG